MRDENRTWAWQEFGDVKGCDSRLKSRLMSVGSRLAQSPSGTVAKVFSEAAERQAAYDLFSNPAVQPRQIMRSIAEATMRRCSNDERIYVPIDGSSVTMSDPSETKQLGSVGMRRLPTRGLQTMSALALHANGTPAGLLDVRFWARGKKSTKSRFKRRRDRDSEMKYVSDSVASVLEVVPAERAWLVIDRGGDEGVLLDELDASGARFTVRAAQNRVVEHRSKRRKLFSVARAGKLIGRKLLQLPATPKRRAREAVVEIRTTTTTLLLRSSKATQRCPLQMNVVEVREQGNRRDRIRWTLLTNAPTKTRQQVDEVITSYRLRWRIEEFHRAWKTGACDVEAIQLRAIDAVRKLATLLAAVAARAERLKHLSRTDPGAPATIELAEVEIRALIVAKRQIKTSVETVPDGIPTIAQATLWIADLGGYSGHYKKGRQPGIVTIARGLERLAIWTDARVAFEADQPKSRAK
jgi:Transposase DNA-binding/Transposase DDE domain